MMLCHGQPGTGDLWTMGPAVHADPRVAVVSRRSVLTRGQAEPAGASREDHNILLSTSPRQRPSCRFLEFLECYHIL